MLDLIPTHKLNDIVGSHQKNGEIENSWVLNCRNVVCLWVFKKHSSSSLIFSNCYSYCYYINISILFKWHLSFNKIIHLHITILQNHEFYFWIATAWKFSSVFRLWFNLFGFLLSVKKIHFCLGKVPFTNLLYMLLLQKPS